jgi:hypothetical protein
MSGTNEAGKVLAATTVVGGGISILGNTNYKKLAAALLVVAIVCGALVIATSALKRWLTRN